MKLSRFVMESGSLLPRLRSILVASKMALPQSEMTWLTARGIEFSVASEANMTCIVIRGYVLPPGYDRAQSDLLLRLSPGFPDVPPDMWWFDPPIRLCGGR